ncbi:glucose/sorbosone family PQQ-dependent dehydrogenase [Pseudoroseicyclus sp. CXY001]|uniref:glucose/sorbosone family PQQ-dependent dehydrogenase n=1 Tax=Pseudoroseicyclus sp. CXY001 TaxID=3242492 RepID=UPI00358DA84B
MTAFIRQTSRAVALATGSTLALGLAVTSAPAVAQETPVEIETGQNDLFSSRVLTTELSNPWAMQWAPDDMIWLTERTSGEVTRVDPVSGEQQTLLTLDDVYTGAQHEGLLGLALHPELMQGTGNDYVYIGYTVNNGTEEEADPSAQIVRYTWDEEVQQLVDPMPLITGLPAWNDHNAGRVVYGPDGMIYYSIGEQGANFGRNYQRPNRAQQLPTADEVASEDWVSYSGKILRMTPEGDIPEDNPTIDGVQSHIYSYGHRNPQGLAFGNDGVLYEAEHGPSTDDELNIIQAGGNYGWPNVAGYIDDSGYLYGNWSAAPEGTARSSEFPPEVPTYPEAEFEPEMVPPLATYFTVGDDFPFGEQCGYICNPTIAPSSILYYDAGEDGIAEWDNSVLLPTLKHGTLYVQPLSEDGMEADGLPTAWFNTQNRYRDVLIGPDNRTVFIATDAFGSAAALYGDSLTSDVMLNPGAILMFTYGGDDTGMPVTSGEDAGVETDDTAPDEAAGEEEFEDEASAAPMDEGTETAEVTDASIAEMVRIGEAKYGINCVSCHGVEGEGDEGVKLAGNENLASAEYVAETLVHGFGYMPPFGSTLDDESIAQVGTYIRNSFGNEFGIVTVEEVAAAR